MRPRFFSPTLSFPPASLSLPLPLHPFLQIWWALFATAAGSLARKPQQPQNPSSAPPLSPPARPVGGGGASIGSVPEGSRSVPPASTVDPICVLFSLIYTLGECYFTCRIIAFVWPEWCNWKFLSRN